MSRFLFPTSIRLASHGCLSGNSSIHRTAVCGPACAVVWEGRRGDSPPIPIKVAIHEGRLEVRRHGGSSAIISLTGDLRLASGDRDLLYFDDFGLFHIQIG